MKQRAKANAVLIFFSLFILLSCYGCSSNSNDADIKLMAVEGGVSDYNIKSSYVYDTQGNLTNLITETSINDFDRERLANRMALSGSKLAVENSTPLLLEYRAKYDDNGNLTRIQVWLQVLDGEDIVYSMLSYQCDYIYTDNKLTDFILSELDTPYGMEDVAKKSYGYDDAGDLVSVEIYRYDYDNDVLFEDPYEIISLTYDLNKNVTEVEQKRLDDEILSGFTYALSYDSDNQLVKHDRYNGVDLDIEEIETADFTYTLVYDDLNNTVTVTPLSNPNDSILYGVHGKDIGYLNMMIGDLRRKGAAKDKDVRPMWSGGVILAPSKFVQTFYGSLFDNKYSDPNEFIAAKQLITEYAYIYTGENPYEELYFDTIFDDNGYPDIMTIYDTIEIYDDVQEEWIYDLGVKFSWK